MNGGPHGIDPAHFSISGGRERWVYRVARKHAGAAGPNGCDIAMPTLFEKSGAEGTYRRFKFEMLAIVRSNDIPGFHLSLETSRGEPVLWMVRGDAAAPGTTRPASKPKSLDASKTPKKKAAGVPGLLFGGRGALSDTIIQRIRHDFPG